MKIQKIAAAVLALTMTAAALPNVSAEKALAVDNVLTGRAAVINEEEAPESDFSYEVNEDGESVTITGYKGNGGNVVIPSEIEGKKVTSIYSAFYDCTSLTSVKIPNSVTSIGINAFFGCTSLTSVEIPDSVTSIGIWAFTKCASLTSIIIPNSVTSIGGLAFNGCTSLTSVEIPDDVTSIDDYTFKNCTSLTSVTIPNSVTSIGQGAFSSCTSLASVTIPDSVTEIGWSVFEGCTSLASVTIPDSVTVIGNGAFEGCTSLTIYGYESSYAQTYAAEHGIPFKILGKEAEINKDTGIIIENPDLTDKTLEVETKSTSDTQIIYNITLKDKDGNKVQNPGDVTVKIPLPNGWDGKKTTVSYKEADGKLTDMNADYENGYMVFTTNHFSEYVLKQKPAVKLGDLNSDEKININDVKIALRGALNNDTLTEDQKIAADVNEDEKVNISDVKIILKAALNGGKL